MHSRVFQISDQPIEKQDWMTDNDIPGWFMGDVADWTQTIDDPSEDYDWLVGFCGGVAAPDKERCFSLREGAKDAFFTRSYQTFKEVVAILSTTTFGAFTGKEPGPQYRDFEYWIYRLNESISDKFGVYVSWDGDPIPINEWLRIAVEGQPYYLGGVVDYHC